MPTVTFDKKDLLKLLGKKVSDSNLSYYISYLGTDLKRITEEEIIVEVFPNRPDMLSIEGFARALRSFMGLKTGLVKYKVNKTSNKVFVEQSVKKVRPFIKCGIIKGIDMKDELIKSLMQVQEKLHTTHGRNRKKVAIGIHDLDKVRFPLKYKAVDPKRVSFVPLGETLELNLKEILERHPKGQKFSWILEDKEKYPVIFDVKGEVISFPPIINSALTQVTEETKNLFIEVTGENEEAVEKALNIIITSLTERGGKIYSVKIDGKESPKLKTRTIRLNKNYVEEVLGLELKETTIKKLLGRMGYEYKNGRVTIPCYRTDILHQFDIIEDIAIAYGYDKFDFEIPNIATIGFEDPIQDFKRKISYALIGFGFLETNTNNLTSEEEERKAGFNNKLIKVKNSLTQGYNALRKHIIPALMKVLSENKHYEYPQKLFEINTVFYEDETRETRVKEEESLGVVIAGKEEDFTRIKQVITALLRTLNLNFEIEEYNSETFIEGRAARIIINGEEIGCFGEVDPRVIESFQLDMPVSAAELNITRLYKIIYEY